MQSHQTMIEYTTVEAMATAFGDAANEIQCGFNLLASAEARLRAAFQPEYGFHALVRHETETGPRGSAATIDRLKREAWRAIIAKLGVRAALSDRRWRELEKQLENGELPNITPEAIEEMVSGLAGNLSGYFAEAVAEVFEFLRPHHSEYKTNSEFEVGQKVVLRYCVERWCAERRGLLGRVDALTNECEHLRRGRYRLGCGCEAIMVGPGQWEEAHTVATCRALNVLDKW